MDGKFQTKKGQTLITFENGYQISIINHHMAYADGKVETDSMCESTSVEVAIFKGDEWVTKEVLEPFYHHLIYDDVEGHVDMKTLAEMLRYIANLKVA